MRSSSKQTCRSSLLTAALFCLATTSLYAQTDHSQSREGVVTWTDRSFMLKPIARDLLHDEVHMWTSPFHRGSYSSHTFTKYVIPFTLITGALIATDHRTANLLPNTADQARWSLRVSQIGAPYTLAGVAAGTYIIGHFTHDKRARETGILGLEAVAHSQLVTLGLKYMTQRERPLTFRDNNSGGVAFGKGGDSFPSGHASSAFALATVFAYEYGPEHRWVPYASYGLASIVAASRFSGEKHWTSDLFVGATTGFLVGRYVYKHHHDPETGHASTSRSVPNVNLGLTHFALAWNLNHER